MNLLQKKIQEASQKYYSDGTSDISDAEFDNMIEQLRKEDPNSPLLSTGHGYDIDKNPTPGARIPHEYGNAGSLDKCHSFEEIPVSFLTDDLYFASLKLDGLSMVLYYRNGVLYRALTRGGGYAGIDKTDKIRIILQKDNKLADTTFTGAVRGEVVMSYQNFEKYKQLHPEAKNPRNSAAGIINSKEVIAEELDLLDLVVYTVVGVQPIMHHPTCCQEFSYGSVWDWLKSNFTHVAEHSFIKLDKDSFMNDMSNLQNTWYGIYPADGIVLARNDLQEDSLDEGKISLIYRSIAFKFKAESETTRIIGIEWNLTKTKYFVPRINVETVQLSGTNVSWATGFNAQNMKDQKLGVGAEVSVLKSGEIIPHIEEVITPVECELPTVCPCCGFDLIWNGVHLQCPNPECADADVQDTLVWMKHVAPWDGLGDTLKLTYLEEMFGDNISIEEIYRHGPFDKKDIETGAVKKTEFRKMFNALFTNQVNLSDAIQALNIPRFGDVNSKKLAEYSDLVINAMNNCSCEYGEHEIGVANYESLMKNKDKFKRLLFIKNNIIWSQNRVESKGKVAITGKLSVKRSMFEQELAEAGYSCGNISKDTDFLITDDPNSASSKNKQADKWGIQKITEHDFRITYMNNH